MTPLGLTDVIAASGGELRGRLRGGTTFARVELDPGRVRPGDLFVAVPGERVDGHELTALAALRGAVAAVVARRWADALRELPLPLVVVDEPVRALQRIAASRRRRLSTTVVGVTGSVGKTTTKDLAASVLRTRFTTYRSPGNRNNEIGLPRCLLELEPDTEVAVLELAGGYAPGEIALLAELSLPRIGIVTNVHPVHLERMGSLTAIERTKAELVDAVPRDGVAVLNGDDPRVRRMGGRCRGSVVTFGVGEHNAVRAVHVLTAGIDGCSFELVAGGERRTVTVPLPGAHVVEAALAAAAAGLALGLGLDRVVAGLEAPDVQAGPRTVAGRGGALVIDDSYNASPPSVASALRLLAETPARRRIAVLGDMLELGPRSEELHREVGRRAGEVVDLLLTIGERSTAIAAEACGGARRPRVASYRGGARELLAAALVEELRPGDVVLVKGSHALALADVVAALAESPRG